MKVKKAKNCGFCLGVRRAIKIAQDTAKKYEAWNWNVITIDGNNAEEIFGWASDQWATACGATEVGYLSRVL